MARQHSEKICLPGTLMLRWGQSSRSVFANELALVVKIRRQVFDDAGPCRIIRLIAPYWCQLGETFDSRANGFG